MLALVGCAFGADAGDECDGEVGRRKCAASEEAIIACQPDGEGLRWTLVQQCTEAEACNYTDHVCEPKTSSSPPSNPTTNNPPSTTCCKVCGSGSKPCGDSCINNSYNCTKPRGCAC